ncbi:hypothetical protein OG711_38810 (plasmid) [Streptomyces uncialis]|uniref:hypothetical protein n=1 Tax=Streptomyces uncialis TaxID=1048205 RepID=UPI002E32BFE3|nr:hypothetical protein [Streptomyces uncialis]
MTTLTSTTQTAVDEFRRGHGDVETWDAVDFEVHQNLVDIVLASGPVGGPLRTARRRANALVVIAYTVALYAAAEVLTAWRGARWTPLETHLDTVIEGPLSRSETALCRSGDLMFRLRTEQIGRRVTDLADRLAGSLRRR